MFSDIKKILSKGEYNTLKIFLLLNVLMFFLETLSILSIPLFVSSIINTNDVLEKINLINLFQNFQISGSSLIKYVSFIVILLFFLKNLSILLLNFYQGKFIEKVKINVSNSLYGHYLTMPYINHLEKDPSTLTRNIIVSTQGLYAFMNHIMNLTRESVAILVILLLLIFTSPLISIFLIIFFSILIFTYLKVIKPKIKSKSNFNNELRKKTTQLIFESFNSIKDLKVLMKERFIFDFFKNNISIFEKNLFYFQFNEKLPKIFLELSSIIFVSLVALLFFSFTDNYTDYLAQISLIIICVFRFIPAFNGVAVSSVYLKISRPDLDNLKIELEEIKDLKNKSYLNITKNNSSSNNKKYEKDFVSVSNLNFTYKNKDLTIKDLDLRIKRGEILGITGDSGAGKSTFFYMMLGLIVPIGGNIYSYGKNIFADLETWRKKTAYVSQNSFLLDGTIRKNIAFDYTENEKISENKIISVLKTAEFYTQVLTYSKGLETQVGHGGIKLSGGEKQRISISRALYNSPEIIFMDESTSALDVESEKKIITNIKKNYPKTTILIIAHRKSTLDLCDRVVTLSSGKFHD